jgi:phenazine biosynthesis protein phzE
VQRGVNLFGRHEYVGFYNTFVARRPEQAPAGVRIEADPDGKVLALRGPTFATFQFHLESVLTRNSVAILRDAIGHLM